MREGMKFPPIVVFFDGKEHWLADGFHRLAAAKKAGFKEIAARVINGSVREAVLFAVGANKRHGLRRNNEDKRRCVLKLLNDKEWAGRGNRWVAETAGVSHPFVAKVREFLHQVETVTTSKRLGRDGKSYAVARPSKATATEETILAAPEPPRDSAESVPEKAASEAAKPTPVAAAEGTDALVAGEAEAKPAMSCSRPERWRRAVTTAREALNELVELQSHYQDWRDGGSGQLGAPTILKNLNAICELDFQTAICVLEDAEQVDPPRRDGSA
jgi:ParB-like chromosome segregation protein Spo0J